MSMDSTRNNNGNGNGVNAPSLVPLSPPGKLFAGDIEYDIITVLDNAGSTDILKTLGMNTPQQSTDIWFVCTITPYKILGKASTDIVSRLKGLINKPIPSNDNNADLFRNLQFEKKDDFKLFKLFSNKDTTIQKIIVNGTTTEGTPAIQDLTMKKMENMSKPADTPGGARRTRRTKPSRRTFRKKSMRRRNKRT